MLMHKDHHTWTGNPTKDTELLSGGDIAVGAASKPGYRKVPESKTEYITSYLRLDGCEPSPPPPPPSARLFRRRRLCRPTQLKWLDRRPEAQAAETRELRSRQAGRLQRHVMVCAWSAMVPYADRSTLSHPAGCCCNNLLQQLCCRNCFTPHGDVNTPGTPGYRLKVAARMQVTSLLRPLVVRPQQLKHCAAP